MARMPLFTSCCGCMSLRGGTIFTGLSCILMAALGIVLLCTGHYKVQNIELSWMPETFQNIVIVINFAMTILISLLLIAGAMKRNMYMMLPWVILGMVCLFGFAFSAVYHAVVWFIKGQVVEGCVALVVCIVFSLVFLYFWVVVYSYYVIVKQECEERAAYSRAPYQRQKI